MIKDHIIYEPFSDWRFKITKAQGSNIWDDQGNKLIDFTSGWNVANLGWNHPELQKAAIRQIKKNAYAPMWTSDPTQEEYAKLLVSTLPKELSAIGRATGGTEANEEAIKIAKSYTKRRKIIGIGKTFHGQSNSTLALGFFSPNVLKQESLDQHFIQIDFPAITSEQDGEEALQIFSATLERLLQAEDIAAVMTESGIVTGLGSARIASKGYLPVIRNLTKKYGTLLIVDEVGTGFSRCGTLFAMESANVVPDIVTFAKGATNGSAVLGTMVTTQKISEESYKGAFLVSTFGWTPVACAVATRTLELHLEGKVWERADKEGLYMKESLQNELKNNEYVDRVGGKGMIVGVHLKNLPSKSSVESIVHQAQKKGLHIVSDHESTLQLMPPLTTPRTVLNEGIDVLMDTLNSIL